MVILRNQGEFSRRIEGERVGLHLIKDEECPKARAHGVAAEKMTDHQ